MSAGGGRGYRGVVIGVVVVLAALVAAAVIGDTDEDTSLPYDPTSTGSSGTKAFVELLERFDADVELTDEYPPRDADVAVAFLDYTYGDEAQQRRLRGWVADGNTLVMADPSSTLTPFAELELRTGFDEVLERGACDLDALDDVRTLDPGDHPVARFRPSGEASTCFTNDLGSFVTVQAAGDGRIVAVGGPDVFTNGQLGEADNAVLAVSLLAPEPGTRVAVLGPPPFEELIDSGTGDPGALLDRAMELRGGLLLVELLVAFGAYALWRGRRLGRPVAEPLPSQIAGSELVVAMGDLLHQTRSPDRAARLLRADLRRQLCERLGLPPDVVPQVIVETVTARTTLPPEVVAFAVTDVPVTSDTELVDLARRVDAVREEVLHGTHV
ncbi:MAG: DUF4350 domain-containing protein [Acidimicrobiales bacterium]|nr:DUF4350 domain-containing protein [Acidimicrobiales bacterium]